MALMHNVVREAISLAQAAGWKVNVIPGNKGIVTIYPPGKYPPLNIAIDPDNEALRKWKGTAAQFGLSGEGPASTPEQREAAAQAMAQAQEEAKKDAAEERETARKRAAEIAAAEAKQQAAIQAGRQAPTGLLFKDAAQDAPQNTPEAPVKQTVPPQAAKAAAPKPVAKKAAAKAAGPVLDDKGYPPFTPSLLTADSPALRLTAGPEKGRFFCPVCLEQGEHFSAKLQQGLASHRGFRHGAYLSPTGGSAVTQAVIPPDVLAALGLLTDSLAEVFASGVDPKELDDAKAKLAEAEKLVTELTGKLTKEQAEHRNTLTTASEWKAKAEQRDKLLNQIQKEHENNNGSAEREKKVLTEQFEKLLRDLRTIGQTLAPVQAVGKIDQKIGEFLGE